MSPFPCMVPRNWFLIREGTRNDSCILLSFQSLNTHILSNINWVSARSHTMLDAEESKMNATNPAIKQCISQTMHLSNNVSVKQCIICCMRRTDWILLFDRKCLVALMPRNFSLKSKSLICSLFPFFLFLVDKEYILQAVWTYLFLFSWGWGFFFLFLLCCYFCLFLLSCLSVIFAALLSRVCRVYAV